MAGETKEGNYVAFLDISDVHDTLKIDEKTGVDYFPKHSAYAKLAEEQGIEFIVNKGDNFDEDRLVRYFLRDVDNIIDLYVSKRLSFREADLAELGSYISYIGEGGGIDEVRRKYNESENAREKRMLSDIISKYDLFGQEEIQKAMIKREEAKEEILSSITDKLKEAEANINKYYKDVLVTALIEAYDAYSGKVLMVQGNHDPDIVFEELQKKAGNKFIFLDRLETPFKYKNFNIAGINNIEKHNLFPKTANFELPDLYSKTLFGITRREAAELILSELQKNPEFMALSDEEKRDVLAREVQEFARNSPVYQKYSKPEFDRIDFLFTHNGPTVGGDELRSQVEKDKNGNKVLKEDGTLKFDKGIGDSDLGLDNIIMRKMYQNKIGFVSSGHIHSLLNPAEIRMQNPFDPDHDLSVVAARTDPDNAFIHYASKDENNKMNIKSRRLSIRYQDEEKKAA
ncbi:hypothetical protein DRJ25_02110 [Candidatus Woesearchaeota archaeon]|nr:MAG: hypothetical protein DRJ25_02110 [Candidatus Woesearchaeota archaeon]